MLDGGSLQKHLVVLQLTWKPLLSVYFSSHVEIPYNQNGKCRHPGISLPCVLARSVLVVSKSLENAVGSSAGHLPVAAVPWSCCWTMVAPDVGSSSKASQPGIMITGMQRCVADFKLIGEETHADHRHMLIGCSP